MWALDYLKSWSLKDDSLNDDGDTKECLKEALAGLETDNNEEDDKQEIVLEEEYTKEAIAKHCSGIVTSVTENLLIIDRQYCVTRVESNFNLKIDQKVGYVLAPDIHDRLRVTKVYPLEVDEWSTNDEDVSIGGATDDSKASLCAKRCIVCQVMKREGDVLHLKTETMGKFEVNLDSVSVDFVPLKGDWLNCEVVCAVNEDEDNFTGELLSVGKMGALRHKVCYGEVTLYKENLQQGIIDHGISFIGDVCSAGYLPHVGDQVLVQCIESHQGALTWRAISVTPESVNDRNKSQLTNNSSSQNNPLYAPKQGASVSLISGNPSLKLGASSNLEVEVKNTADEVRRITSYKMRTIGNKSQITITNGPKLPFILKPNSNFIFALKAVGSFIGKSNESLVLSFDDKFHVGCEINLTIDDDRVTNLKATTRARTEYQPKNKYAGGNFVPTRNGLVCPGVKPIKAPPFIPVHSVQCPVPLTFYQVATEPSGRPRNPKDAEERLREVCPALFQPLDKVNYLDKFHALLHLEEMNTTLQMRRYNQERAIFNHNGDYYTLEVPNLQESRPSLIIGDRVYAKNEDVSESAYEGFIHKTSFNEVWLKFGAPFDNVARGNSFEVQFVHSRGTFQKCHTAIETFCRKEHLGVNWLFPSSIKTVKPPQVIFENHERKQIDLKDVPASDENHTIESKGSPVSRLNKLLDAIDGNEVSDSTSLNTCSDPNENEKSNGVSSVNEESNPELSNLRESVTDSSEPIEEEQQNKVGSPPKERKMTSLDSAYRHYTHSVELQKRSREKIVWASSGRGYGDSLSKAPIVRPCPVMAIEKISWFNQNLNEHQKDAVKNILRGENRPMPYVIFGPPGTGKTVTMVETILQILTVIPDSRILIATPSNSAADLIADRILAAFTLLPGQLVRLVSFSYHNEKRIPPHLIPYSAIADLNEHPDRIDDRSGAKTCSRESLGRHRVTIGTCTSIGVMYTLGFPVGHFTHVFADEAGQATEPEILIPLAFLHEANGQAILAGDPMQLGPVVMSLLANSLGLGHSLLYRFLLRCPYAKDQERFPSTGGYDPRLVTKLVDNYRSIPEVLYLPSKLFYDSELISHVSPEGSFEEQILRKLKSELPLSKFDSNRAASLVFHGMRGDNCQEGDSPSWFNPQEVVQVLMYLRKVYEVGMNEEQVGIITPYQKQAKKIRQLINEMGLPMPKVGSVEEFQGQERHIIIVSVVRSINEFVHSDLEQALGFLRNPFRVNVTISRARALLIVVGNPYLIGHDVYWRSIIEYSAEIGGYTGCNYPEFLQVPKECKISD